MPIRTFACPTCGSEKQSFKAEVICSDGHDATPMEKLFSAPQSKFMEASNPEKGKSKMKDLNKMLMERSKEYARLNEHDDFIQEKSNPIDAKNNGWLTKDGIRRKKIDDR